MERFLLGLAKALEIGCGTVYIVVFVILMVYGCLGLRDAILTVVAWLR